MPVRVVEDRAQSQVDRPAAKARGRAQHDGHWYAPRRARRPLGDLVRRELVGIKFSDLRTGNADGVVVGAVGDAVRSDAAGGEDVGQTLLGESLQGVQHGAVVVVERPIGVAESRVHLGAVRWAPAVISTVRTSLRAGVRRNPAAYSRANPARTRSASTGPSTPGCERDADPGEAEPASAAMSISPCALYPVGSR